MGWRNKEIEIKEMEINKEVREKEMMMMMEEEEEEFLKLYELGRLFCGGISRRI